MLNIISTYQIKTLLSFSKIQIFNYHKQFWLSALINTSIDILLLMNKENFRPTSSRLHKNNHSLTPRHQQKSSVSHIPKQKTTRDDYQQQCMKLIIANNAEYFQNKIRLIQKNSSKDLRLKLPSHTGMTTYRKEYNQKQTKYNQVKGIKHNKSTDCIKVCNFLKDEDTDVVINDKTSYQKQFKKHPIVRSESCRRWRKKKEILEDDQKVPRFLDTQNKNDFLNWAGKNYVPSMKPKEKTAATNLPFEATTVYRSQYDGRSVPPTPLFNRQSSFPKFGIITTPMRSNYSSEFFIKKSHGVEISCKPKHTDATLCKQFKGSTEYKRQYQTLKEQRSSEDDKCKTIEELQALIIDL